MAKTPAKPKTTKANTPVSWGCADRQHQSVSVRKIQNGFIVSRSSEGPKGYTSTEEFTPTKPKIEMSVSTKGKR